MSEHQEQIRKRLGELVTEAYKTAGLTRQALAPLVGISERSLYMIENAQSIPRAHTQARLEEALGWQRGAIKEVLSLGPSVDINAINLSHMRPATGEGWGPLETAATESPMTRLNMAAADIAILLREKDKEIADLKQQVKVLQEGYDLAADNTPNQGRRLRAVLDDVEDHNVRPTDS